MDREKDGRTGRTGEREKVYYMMGLDERETRQDTNKYERKGGPTVQFLLSIMNGGRKKRREKEREMKKLLAAGLVCGATTILYNTELLYMCVCLIFWPK